MHHVYLTVFSLETQIMGTAAVRLSMAATTTVPTVTNAIAFRNRVAGLATPVAFGEVSVPWQ